MFCLFSAFFFLKNPLAAQQSTADSLLQLINSRPDDTLKVNHLVDYAWEVIAEPIQGPDRRLVRAIKLAQDLKFLKGEAYAWNALGVHRAITGNLDSAVLCYEKALPIRQKIGDKKGVAALFNNLGNAYGMLGKPEKALQNHQNNLRSVLELGDAALVAEAYFNIATVRESMRDFTGAYQDANEYLVYVEKQNDDEGRARAYGLIGGLRFGMTQWDESEQWYEKALKLRRELEDEYELGLALNNMGNAQAELKKHPEAIRSYQEALSIFESLGDDYEQARVLHNLASAYRELPDFEMAMQYIQKALKLREDADDPTAWMETQETYGDILYEQGKNRQALQVVQAYFDKAQEIGDKLFIQKGYKDLAKIHAKLGQYEKAYHFRKEYDELRYEIYNQEQSLSLDRAESLFSNRKKEWELENNKLALKEKDAQIKRDRLQQRALLGGGIALVAIAGLLFYLNRVRAKANTEMDRLLKNILPESTAEELKQHNKVAPVRYESVSVLFTDFKGFTTIAEQMEPEELVAELDNCFRLFDEITERHGLEKIKTIGDAYMCAGGLPKINNSHPKDAVRAALEMQGALAQVIEKRRAAQLPVFEMRVGIHSGPVVAGVVGSHKFAYDIWGDTVNTASRMESASEPGRVNISAATYELVKAEFECTYRGKLEAKNKGAIDMYFVERARTDLEVPNIGVVT